MNQLSLILLGSILALVSSFSTEIYKIRRSEKDNRKNLKIILHLEFKNVIDIFEKLFETYGSKHYFEFKTLEQLKESIKRLDLSRDKVVFLREDVKKEEILSVINDISIFHSDAVSLENFAFGDTNNDPNKHMGEYFKGGRQVISLKSIDLKRRVQDLINYLRADYK